MAHTSFDAKHQLLFLALVAAGNVKLARAQAPVASTTTSDFYAPLSDLSTPAPQKIGGANFTRCCLSALQDWQQDPSGSGITVQSSNNPFNLFNNPNQLADSGEQFPCGATYQQNPLGAPQVFITYDWCATNCGGWAQSTNAVLTQWIQPFVGFILPAAVFCLNVSNSPLLQLVSASRLHNSPGI